LIFTSETVFFTCPSIPQYWLVGINLPFNLLFWMFDLSSGMKGSLPFTKVIPLEEKDTDILLMEFPYVMYPNHVRSVLTLWVFNSSSSFYVADSSCDCLYIVSSFLSALTFLKDLDMSTSDSFKASTRLFFAFSTSISLLNNFLFNFLTFTTSSYKLS